MTLLREVTAAAEVLGERLGRRPPELAMVLGSGLSALTAELLGARSVAFEELPGFPPVGVAGHGGRVWSGTLCGRQVVLFQGRYHVYEGYDAYQVTASVRLAKELGCSRILLTNAAGGISPRFAPGHFMLVSDHLNLVGDNPLRGLTPAPFVDLCSLYRWDFYADLRQSLQEVGVELHRGTLAWMPGPSYETPAEIRMLERLGAAAVSMSTVPEAIMAHALGMETVAISLIANAAAGKSSGPLSHGEVLTTAASAVASLPLLISQLLFRWK